MTTSGSTDFTLSRDDIIQAAALEVGDIAEGEELGDDTIETYGLRLNSWVKSLMANGAKLWALKQATLFLARGTATYTLGADGAHCTNSFTQTTLSAAAAAAATTVDLTAFADLADADNIGILLDEGAIHWTTIDGTPGATTTLADALPSAAAAGNTVFAYTTRINRPQRIDTESAFWRSAAGQDTPVKMLARAEYAQLANKASTGKIVQGWYNPQLVDGVLSVWPAPDSETDVLMFWYERILEDFDDGTDTPDFAPEWGEALILGLAHRMSRSAGMPLAERQDLERAATNALTIAESYNKENTSTFFQPDFQ